MKYFILFVIFVVASAVILDWYYLSSISQVNRLEDESLTLSVMARIIGVHGGLARGPNHYTVEYEFEDEDGKVYKGESIDVSGDKMYLSAGDRVEVRYLRENPQISRIPGRTIHPVEHTKPMAIVMSIFAAFFVIVFLYALIKGELPD